MDNTVFERNYETPQEDMEYCTAVFEQAVEGGFFQRYCDMVDKVPKIINRKLQVQVGHPHGKN